jgi:hypothetical protein
MVLLLAGVRAGAPGVHAQHFPKLKAGLWAMERSPTRPTN